MTASIGSGEPDIKDELLGFWRMDEQNGTAVQDSVIPLRMRKVKISVKTQNVPLASPAMHWT